MKRNPLHRLLNLLLFLPFYVKEVVKANMRIAWDIVTPNHHFKPAFVELEIGDLTDTQLLALTNLITMTPGTLSFDISNDRKRLLLHVLYLDESPDDMRKSMEKDYIRKICSIF